MSYVPTEWETGDIVTAEKLNNIENGIVNNNIYIVSITSNIEDSTGDETLTLDKTWQEISDAAQSGKLVKFIRNIVEELFGTEELSHRIEYTYLTAIAYGPEWEEAEERYIDSYEVSNGLDTFKALDPNDYPIGEPQK